MWDLSQHHESSQKPTGIFLTVWIQVTAYVKIHKQSKRSPLQHSLCGSTPTQPLIGSNENKHGSEAGTVAVRGQHGAGQRMLPGGMFEITLTKSSRLTTMIYQLYTRDGELTCAVTFQTGEAEKRTETNEAGR